MSSSTPLLTPLVLFQVCSNDFKVDVESNTVIMITATTVFFSHRCELSVFSSVWSSLRFVLLPFEVAEAGFQPFVH